MNESHAMWLLTIPVCFSLVASLVFLINVVRVLLTKLSSTSPHPAPLGLRKATRATLILVRILFRLRRLLNYCQFPNTEGRVVSFFPLPFTDSPVWSAAHPAAVSAGEGLLAGTVLSDRGRPADQPARFVRFVPVLLRKPRRHLCGTVLPEPIFPRPRDAPVSREQRWAAGHAKPRRGRMTTERASLHTDEYKPARSDSPRAGPVCRMSRVSCCCCVVLLSVEKENPSARGSVGCGQRNRRRCPSRWRDFGGSTRMMYVLL